MSKTEDKNRVFPVEEAKYLDRSIRKWLQKPNKILGNWVKEGMTVLDFGSGTGYFTTEIAKLVKETGKVLAVDLQQGMLDIIRHKIEGTDLEKRISLIKCETRTINVQEMVDMVFAFYVVHEVPNKNKFLMEVKSILKPSGILMIVEPMGHVGKREFEELIKWAEETGFHILSSPKIFFSHSVVMEKK
jgi:ubiquinone/menaquinone biosynthesis C-methylase UbiE